MLGFTGEKGPQGGVVHNTSVLSTLRVNFGYKSIENLQVEHEVHPHLVFDVRLTPRESLPSELKGALPLPGITTFHSLSLLTSKSHMLLKFCYSGQRI